MEGDTVQPRPLFHLLRILPTPVRWLGQELVRLVHWLDHGAGRLLLNLRTSPAWCFVTLVGTIGVGLTILLFISVIDQTSVHHSKPANRATVQLGRAQLEKNYEWSAQDHWRIAHFFVPHKPAEPFKNIQIDSRLMTSDDGGDVRNNTVDSRRNDVAQRLPITKDIEVRLETSRPRKAQQEKRLISKSTLSSRTDRDQNPGPRIHQRNSRLLVQASWEFGSDCARNDYVALPVRRPIPEYVPEPEVLPAPQPKSTPDISFEMVMIRHFMTSAPFPPGSHLVSQSDRSSFPVDDPRYQNALVSYGDQIWQRSEPTRESSEEVVETVPYTGIGIDESLTAMRQTSEEIDPTLPAIAEVDLNLELIVPRLAVAGQSHESMLIVRNEGRDSIPRIEVQDLMSESQTIIAASPDASLETVVDSESGTRNILLHREVLDLPSGDGQGFSLRWIPEIGRRSHIRTRVIAEAVVSTTTDVERPEPDQQMQSIPPEIPPEKHPALACDVDYPEKVLIGNAVELKIRVRNTGETTLHDVKVRIELPDQLSHPDGNELIFDAGKILMHGHAQTVVELTASQVGDAVNVLQATSAEHIRAQGRVSILVVERPKEPVPLVTNPESNRPKPLPIPSSARKLEPLAEKHVERCCCQRSSAYMPFNIRNGFYFASHDFHSRRMMGSE